MEKIIEKVGMQIELNMCITTNCEKGIKSPYSPSVYNKGYLGEGKYKTKVNGNRTKEYEIWKGVLRRCFSEKEKERNNVSRSNPGKKKSIRKEEKRKKEEICTHKHTLKHILKHTYTNRHITKYSHKTKTYSHISSSFSIILLKKKRLKKKFL